LPNVSAVYARVHQGSTALTTLSDTFIDSTPFILIATPAALYIFLRRKRKSTPHQSIN
jgi:hypothetical protein